MYWDVIEVKPETGYRLFVRFKDGLQGHVQLHKENLTGALAPLLDAQFFSRAFIDQGAVSWPGEIDLAPDEMYTQISLRNKLPRFYELRDLISNPSDPDAYDFVRNLEDPLVPWRFDRWEEALDELDPVAWESLKKKAFPHLALRDRKLRWEQLLNVLGEAFAYGYLKSQGWQDLHFIPESDRRTPDIEGTRQGALVMCEVKTINLSDVEVEARHNQSTVRGVGSGLSERFFRKLDLDIDVALAQLRSHDLRDRAQYVIYINIDFDDWVPAYHDEFIDEIRRHLLHRTHGVTVVVNPGASKEAAEIVLSAVDDRANR
jgi:hypothetical protein